MQINRLMEILFVLLSRDSVKARTLAEQFDVSERTIYRDVDVLTLANIPVVMTKGRNGGIKLLDSFKLDKAVLNDNEKHEILSSLNIFGSIAPEGCGVIEKLRGIFGKTEGDWIEIDFDNWSNESGQKEIFAKIKESILNKTLVAFKYHSAGGNSERVAMPLKLCFKGQAWYLYGYCKVRNDYRFFKLTRIKELKILNEAFSLVAKKNVLNDLQYNDTFINLTLIISKDKAYRVYDEFSDIEILDNGNFLVRCKYPQGEWLYQAIASYLGDCQVVEPLYIKEKMTQIYNKALNNATK